MACRTEDAADPAASIADSLPAAQGAAFRRPLCARRAARGRRSTRRAGTLVPGGPDRAGALGRRRQGSRPSRGHRRARQLGDPAGLRGRYQHGRDHRGALRRRGDGPSCRFTRRRLQPQRPVHFDDPARAAGLGALYAASGLGRWRAGLCASEPGGERGGCERPAFGAAPPAQSPCPRRFRSPPDPVSRGGHRSRHAGRGGARLRRPGPGRPRQHGRPTALPAGAHRRPSVDRRRTLGQCARRHRARAPRGHAGDRVRCHLPASHRGGAQGRRPRCGRPAGQLPLRAAPRADRSRRRVHSRGSETVQEPRLLARHGGLDTASWPSGRGFRVRHRDLPPPGRHHARAPARSGRRVHPGRGGADGSQRRPAVPGRRGGAAARRVRAGAPARRRRPARCLHRALAAPRGRRRQWRGVPRHGPTRSAQAGRGDRRLRPGSRRPRRPDVSRPPLPLSRARGQSDARRRHAAQRRDRRAPPVLRGRGVLARADGHAPLRESDDPAV